MNNNIFIYLVFGIIVLFISRTVYLYYYKTENFKNVNFKVLDECKDITPKQLLNKFNNNYDELVKVFSENDIPVELVKSYKSYPIIASYLVSKNIIKC